MNYKNIGVKNSNDFNLPRRIISYMTTSSWHNIPHVSFIYEPDITDFYDNFKKLARERSRQGYKVSFNTIMMKVIIEGLLNAPELNSFVEYNHKQNNGTAHILDDINISIPWLLPDGRMITPAILKANKMSLRELSNYILNLSNRIEHTNIDEMLYKVVYNDTLNELKNFNPSVIRRILASQIGRNKIVGLKGKEKETYYSIPESERLTEKDIMIGSVTVSNIGSLYKEQKGFLALLEIIPPQVLAIGLGSIQEKPGIQILKNGDKEIGIRKVLPMCLAFDHRAVDFSSMIPFLKMLDEIFSNPSIIHKW